MKKSTPVKIKKITKPVVPAQTHAVSNSGVAHPRAAVDSIAAAVGRRKTATARIRLSHGGNVFTVNGKTAGEYFKSIDPMGVLVQKAFALTNTLGAFSCSVKVEGSGLQAQLGATVHGIARALAKINEEHKKTLRTAGLLTRDDRMKESRKIGTGGKARRAKQSPKR